MAPRKTKTPKVPKDTASLMEPPKTLTIPELELLKLTRAEAEMRAAAAEMSVQKTLRESVLQKIDPNGLLRQLDQRIQLLGAKAQEARAEYEQLRDAIGKSLGVDMSKYAFDDRTGVLHDISDKKS